MHVLHLVTNQSAPFFEQQIDSLHHYGVSGTTLGVSGQRDVTDDESSGRSIREYVKFYTQVLSQSAESYDLVHAHYGLIAPMALAQPNRPVVLTLWGSDLLGNIGWLSKRCARRSDAVIVMSQEMADMLSVDCHVIPHGIDLTLFRPLPQRPSREAVGWQPGAKHVLFPYAAQRDVKDYPRAERVVEQARNQLNDEVILHTLYDVPHKRMPLYMNAADALLLTSKSEGSPNSVKEAIACNLPVVATDVGDVGVLLSDVEPSYVCQTDRSLIDGLVAVLELERPSNGRESAKQYGLDRMGGRIRSVYESVL